MSNKFTVLLITFMVCIAFTSPVAAQQFNDQPSSFWSKLRYGGNVGAGFSNGFTSIIIAPQAVYPVTNDIGIGLGLNYSYSERDFDDPNFIDFKSNIVGGSLIAIGNPIDFLQLSADFEYLNVNQNFDDRSLDRTYWVPALFLGAGYRQGNFILGARYDVLYNDNRSVYQNGIQPFVRVLF